VRVRCAGMRFTCYVSYSYDQIITWTKLHGLHLDSRTGASIHLQLAFVGPARSSRCSCACAHTHVDARLTVASGIDGREWVGVLGA
jgi:hypothetical protein